MLTGVSKHFESPYCIMYSIGNNHTGVNSRQEYSAPKAGVPNGVQYYDPSFHQPPPPSSQYGYNAAAMNTLPKREQLQQQPQQQSLPPLSVGQQQTYQPALAHVAELNSKFNTQDIQILRQLLLAGEKHKWKHITKEINSLSSSNTNSNQSYGKQHPKNVSPTFVIKQYQNMLGIPSNNVYFGHLGSSLPYVVAEKGWDDVATDSRSNIADI